MRTLISILVLAFCCKCFAVELLVEARSRNISANDIGGRALRGMIIVAKPDGWPWGLKERPSSDTNRYCAVIKIPGIPVSRVQKYVEAWRDGDTILSYRRWHVRWADLPIVARNKLRDTGTLTIKATDTYEGQFDYTWAQVKIYFRNLETGLDETEDL